MKNVYTYIRKLFLRRKFFMKLLIYSLLIAIIPNMVTSIMTYVSVTKVFRQEASTKNRVLLTQMKNAMELLVRQIQENGKQVIYNTSFRNFENFPNGYYYENLSGFLKTEDLPTNYWYLRNKQEAINSINLFRTSSSYVDTVYYYDKEKSIMLTFGAETSFKQYDFGSFYDKDWYDPLNEYAEKSSIFMDTRTAVQPNQSVKDVITLIIRSNVSNAFIINMDASKLERQIVSKLSDQDNLLIVSREGGPIFQRNGDKTTRELLGLIEDEPRVFQDEYMTFTRKNMLITSTYSSELGWSFINYASMDNLEQGLNYLKQQILMSSLALLCATILIAFLSSKKLYRPLQQVVDMLRRQKPKTEGGVQPELKDEFQDIEDFVRLTVYEKDRIIDKLQESLPYYREKFIVSLLKPSPRTWEEIRAKLDYLGIEFEWGPVICLVVSMDDYNILLEADDPKIADLYRIKVIHLLQRCDCDGERTLIAEVDDDKVAMVLSMGRTGLDDAFLIAERLVQMLRESMGGGFTVGVGSLCSDMTTLPNSFQGALESLQFRFLYGGDQVIFIEDVSLLSSGDQDWFKRLSDDYLAAIKLGKAEEAKETLAAVVDNIREKRIHYNEARSFFVQLLQALQHGVLSLGGKTERLFGPDPYRDLALKQRVEDIIEWFEELTDKVITSVSEELNAKRTNHIAKLLDIIDADLSQDLSLNTVAGRLSLNPSYVSRLFKQFVGKTFVDYVTIRRIERGKHLLETTDMKVGDVATSVGYLNAYYFIKLFKEATGVTPGEYRKQGGRE